MDAHLARRRRNTEKRQGDFSQCLAIQRRACLVTCRHVSQRPQAGPPCLGKGATLEILGMPTGIWEDVNFAADEAAAAAPTEVADDARGGARRSCGLRVEEAMHRWQTAFCGPTSASHVAQRGDDADAAATTRPATVYCAENGAAPADNTQPATGTSLA